MPEIDTAEAIAAEAVTPQKTKLAFFIVEIPAGWMVRADGFVYPLCASFADALASATREAQSAGLLGFASVVLARPALDLPYEVRWVYGRDAYAPDLAPPSFRSETRH